jgi:NADPH-dependent glutamate synthase beta subunit-like oxidoreductase
MSDLQKEYDCVFISAGAHVSRKLGVDGEDLPGVDYGVEFLRQAADKDNGPRVGAHVVVIGGGNVAIDVARTALRLGAKQVEMVALEKRDEMPAYEEEVAATLAEGIIINNGWGPNRIIGAASVQGIELKQCTRVFDENGRFNPAYNQKNLKNIVADQVIVAIGQAIDADLLDHVCVDIERGCFKVDPVTLETSLKGVFAGGDNASGPASVIQAVAAGKGRWNRWNATSRGRTCGRTVLKKL